MGLIYQFLEDESLPKGRVESTRVRSKASNFVLIDGVLHFVDKLWSGERGEINHRIAIPEVLVDPLIDESHRGMLGGHVGETKLYDILRLRYMFPAMLRRVKARIKQCEWK